MLEPRELSATVRPGDTFALGARVREDGVNFCIYAQGATALELVLFDDADGPPARLIRLDPRVHRTFRYWHVFVPGLAAGQLYGFRAEGPPGLRFDGEKLLLDPYGRAVAVPKGYDREAGVQPGDHAERAMKSVVVDWAAYDWEGDHPLARPSAETVVYELHVRGFTRHESSGVAPERRGTYAGLVEKIPYLVDLGVTAVELLPVFQFDVQDGIQGLPNYWGYSPVSFFAPHLGYASTRDPLAALDEFRDMVKALHRASIEVILDVVYNHTAEGNQLGPTFCFRGLADGAYYLQGPSGGYLNYSGTGNTINANHAVVRRLILDSLTYWVREMHVDGFRFDLASILSRGEDGTPLHNPPILWAIESEPALAGAKLIAEAWDAGGLYQVGSFVGDRWKEWNGAFRDDVRSFLKGDPGVVCRLASRMLASPDIYAHRVQEPGRSVNFVTCHDGFTLNDLVSYDAKHNDANREGNRDGHEHNLSWNCGVEGPTDDPVVEALRLRQIKNFLAINLLALGTPMLLMGDEMRRSQQGNNNAWCQDNELSWLDWTLLERNAGLHRFVKLLIAFRQRRDVVKFEDGLPLPQILEQADMRWHGVRLDEPDWSWDSHTLAATVESLSGNYALHVAINAFWDPVCLALPEASYDPWRRVVDTARESPHDLELPGTPLVEDVVELVPRSLVLLVSANAAFFRA